MASRWIIAGLIVATVCVSTLAASFSVIGLGALFSGAVLAVYAMSSSLEFAKFVLAAYLHQRWAHLHRLFKVYLLFATVILSAITSMGIFGFLSDAYQSSSTLLDSETVKLNSLKNQQAQNLAERDRLQKSIDEIPASRVSKKMALRAELEPRFQELKNQAAQYERQVSDANLHILEVKKRVGPLIYIARAFNQDLDTVVKYLILVFVSVFDPLALCLVIATSEALNSRQKTAQNQQPAASVDDEEVIHMRFADEPPAEASPEEAGRNQDSA